MDISEFEECMTLLAFCYFDEYCFFPREMELSKDDGSFLKFFESYEELYDYSINGRTIREIITDKDYDVREYIC